MASCHKQQTTINSRSISFPTALTLYKYFPHVHSQFQDDAHFYCTFRAATFHKHLSSYASFSTSMLLRRISQSVE